jgi:hypothetical protein
VTTKADGDFRLAFWTHFTNRWPDELSHGEPNRMSSRWRKPAIRGFVVAQFLSEDAVGVFIRGERSVSWEATGAALKPFESRLQTVLGEPITDGEFYFNRSLRLDTHDRGYWDRMSDWLHEQADVYVATLKTVLGEQA